MLVDGWTPYDAYLAVGFENRRRGLSYSDAERAEIAWAAEELSKSDDIQILRRRLTADPTRRIQIGGLVGHDTLLDLTLHGRTDEIRRASARDLCQMGGLLTQKSEVHLTGAVETHLVAKMEQMTYGELAVRSATLLAVLGESVPGMRGLISGAGVAPLQDGPVVLHQDAPPDEGSAGPGEAVQEFSGPVVSPGADGPVLHGGGGAESWGCSWDDEGDARADVPGGGSVDGGARD